MACGRQKLEVSFRAHHISAIVEEFQAWAVLIPDVIIPVSICFEVGSAGLHGNVKLINHKMIL